VSTTASKAAAAWIAGLVADGVLRGHLVCLAGAPAQP